MIIDRPGGFAPAIQSRCVVLFAKAPVSGQVKTRLASRIGPHNAALLYRSFILDIIDMLAGIRFSVRIYFDPPDRRDDLANFIGRAYSYFPQTGKDLGEKMANALRQTFDAGVAAAVLIGTDFPDLPGPLVSDALTALSESPAVIGPSMDGGYYLIGFTKKTYYPAVFDNICWGNSHVLEETMASFSHGKIDVRILPSWRDIDTIDDLNYFIHKNAATPEKSPATFDCLKAIGLWAPK